MRQETANWQRVTYHVGLGDGPKEAVWEAKRLLAEHFGAYSWTAYDGLWTDDSGLPVAEPAAMVTVLTRESVEIIDLACEGLRKLLSQQEVWAVVEPVQVRIAKEN